MKRTEHTQKWLDALRSGEFEQAYGTLEENGCFCALGVGGNVIFQGKNYFYSDLTRALGFDYGEASEVIDMNDIHKKSFPEIADAIEQMIEADTNGN